MAVNTAKRELQAKQVLIQPFDIEMWKSSDGQGLYRLQDRFALWLRSLSYPSRFVCWQMPADLRERIAFVASLARQEDKLIKKRLLMESRRFYEQLQNGANYQRSLCGLALWADENMSSQGLASSLSAILNTQAIPSAWPRLFEGQYLLNPPEGAFRDWHLRPVGRPGGRYYFALLSSYEFLPVNWTFGRPLAELLSRDYPLALCVDFPNSFERSDAIQKVEGVKMATEVHLITGRGEDSRSRKKYNDCEVTLQQLNAGDLLHEVQLIIAVAAPDRSALKKAVDDILNRMKPYVRLRVDKGEGQLELAKFFSATASRKLALPRKTWTMVSQEAALLFAPLGFRKLAGIDGTMRGQSLNGSHPFFFNSWGAEKKATHELWVGQTGSGKTFSLNVFLQRQYTEEGIAFDLLEPMGHGYTMAQALDLPCFVPSPLETRMNPLDVMYPEATEQITHVLHLIETILGRQFAGTSEANFQKGLLGQALESLYGKAGGMAALQPESSPIMEDLASELRNLNIPKHLEALAEILADEIAHLCTGVGPYARFLNARTNLDLSFRAKAEPRVFSFHQMSSDPELLALSYTQVLAAIRRDSLADETPRTIAVDEVYRLMRHPALLDFLVEAVKTFRTRRKKVICIDQNMSIFMTGKARLLLENSPIKVIFNQRDGMPSFDDPAFNHLTASHKEKIANFARGAFLLDVQELGIYPLQLLPSPAEKQRFGSS